MRQLVDDYSAVLATLEPAAEGAVPSADSTGARVERVQALRDEARMRMQEAIAALETLRVELLRLSAGTAEVGSVTTRLGTAREVAADIARLLEAQEDVDRLLRR
jgi:hypothetical protein